MGLVKDNSLVDDPYFDASAAESVPPTGPVIVSLAQWQAQREALLARGAAARCAIAQRSVARAHR